MKALPLKQLTLLLCISVYLLLVLPGAIYGHYLADNERITLAIVFYLVFRGVATMILLGIVHLFKLIVPADKKTYKRFALVYLFVFGLPMYIMFVLWTNAEQPFFTYIYATVEIIGAYFAVDFFRLKGK